MSAAAYARNFRDQSIALTLEKARRLRVLRRRGRHRGRRGSAGARVASITCYGGGVGRRKELHQWGGRTRLRNSSGLSLARMRPGAAGRAGALGIGALGALGRFCRVMSCVSHGTYAAAPAPKVLEAVGDEVHVLVAREGRLGVVLVHSGQPEHEAAAGTQKRIRIRQQVVDQLRQVVRLGRWEVVGAPGLVRARTCGPVCRLP